MKALPLGLNMPSLNSRSIVLIIGYRTPEKNWSQIHQSPVQQLISESQSSADPRFASLALLRLGGHTRWACPPGLCQNRQQLAGRRTERKCDLQARLAPSAKLGRPGSGHDRLETAP